jgi:hypothetical protein
LPPAPGCGGDLAVRGWPQFFAADGTPEHELKRLFTEALPAPVPDPEPLLTIPPGIPDDGAAEAIEGFTMNQGFGRHVKKGERLRLDDQLVIDHPELFRLPGKPLA